MLSALPMRTRIIFAALLILALISIALAPIVFETTRSRGQFDATKDLLSVTQAPRTTDYPGVTAWLQVQLQERCKREPNAEAKANCSDLLKRSSVFSPQLKSLEMFLKSPPKYPDVSLILTKREKKGRLCLSEFKVGNNRYVVTSPLLEDNCRDDKVSDFAKWAVTELEARSVPLPMTLELFGDVKALRGFILRQDGTLVSRRFSDDNRNSDTVGSEYQSFAQVADSSGTPALGSVNSFFSMTQTVGNYYTGAYIDVTDLGVVATGLTLEKWENEDVVLAVDVAMGTAWMSDLSSTQPRLTPVNLVGDATWSGVAAEARVKNFEDLANMASTCGDDSRALAPVTTCASLNNDEMLAAVRVGEAAPSKVTPTPKRSTWLIAWMPKQSAPHAVVTILPGFLLMIGAFVFVWTESTHRKSDDAAKQALRDEIGTLNGRIDDLLQIANSMDVAVITIDPNTDRVRYLNAKARELAIPLDSVFREFVSEEDRTAYDRFNSVTGDSQRAYAVRLNAQTGNSCWAIIRSRTFDKAIPGFNARENDRLGVVSILSQEELSRLFASLDSKAISEERSKLASLMAHGVASLARLIPKEQDPDVRLSLHRFMTRRIEALTAILAGWGSPLEDVRKDEVAIRREDVEAVLRQLRALAEQASQDRMLRQRLAWENGVLSSLSKRETAFIFDLSNWETHFKLTSRLAGAEFFILEELLVNSLKYGVPGSTPVLMARVVQHPDQRWVEFTLRNEVKSGLEIVLNNNSARYGGRTLVIEACRRLGWVLEEPQLRENEYVVRWRARCIESKDEKRR